MALPIPTFGCCMALAFAGAYWTFRQEYRRKTRLGVISIGGASSARPSRRIAWWIAGGFFAGAKLGYVITYRSFYLGGPGAILFSTKGDLTWGFVGGALGLVVGLLSRRSGKKADTPADPVTAFMDTLLVWCGATGFAGAILFAKFDDTRGLLLHSLTWLVTYNGISFYGGFIFGFLTFVYLNRLRGIKFLTSVDIGSPGMMLAYGIGRIGCQLAGDGDWGIVNLHPKPSWLRWFPDWAWSSRFPHNVIHQGTYIPGCADNFCSVLVQPVYPTSLYESVICLLLFGVLWWLRGRLRQPGLLFGIFALFNGIERFFIEYIKTNPKYELGGLALSQAQWIALGWIGAGACTLVIQYLYKHSR